MHIWWGSDSAIQVDANALAWLAISKNKADWIDLDTLPSKFIDESV